MSITKSLAPALLIVLTAGAACGPSSRGDGESVGSARAELNDPPWEDLPDPDPDPTAPGGAFAYSVPLDVPEGRADMAPSL